MKVKMWSVNCESQDVECNLWKEISVSEICGRKSLCRKTVEGNLCVGKLWKESAVGQCGEYRLRGAALSGTKSRAGKHASGLPKHF